MKVIATLMITLFVLQASVATVPGRSGRAVCQIKCWVNYDRCVSAAYDEYRRCRRFGEEMQCYFALQFQKAICNREYRSCNSGCR